ncbi:hypothetical protein LTR37_017091 [Vermiconidia calcicola]|uniref:Uncharacterized protein n=1 Tax=Vermiconidia calcicola TaxID=1690605 RepID=A0ACC3ML41_9PEZI|nr:hypothetical protein LTR37_017091 [Vermiconidia calcicola]
MVAILDAVERWISRSRGALFEGDICEILRSCRSVVRAFEFSPTDAAVDCSREYIDGYDYAQRLWDLLERPKTQKASELALFEVKSSIGRLAGSQEYISTAIQKMLVAFYIGVCAADPTFVDVIPNYDQDAALFSRSDCGEDEDVAATLASLKSRYGDREELINVSRISTLPTSAYGGLDQCMGPYRMPIWRLPEAMGLIRAHIRGESVYVNPHTGVSFPDWKPLTTQCTTYLHPADDTDAYMAYRVVMDVLTAMSRIPDTGLHLAFVGLQPRLADFTINGRFVQQKVDNTRRAKDSPMSKVLITRGEGSDRRYYLTAFDRFDFLWYQFTFARFPGGPIDYEFYLLPEKVIPDPFYETLDKHVSFEREEFRQYRVPMDREGRWIAEVKRIIDSHPHPRKKGTRPVRTGVDHSLLPEDEEPSQGSGAPAAGTRASSKAKGRREYKETLTLKHRRFFYRFMKQCAKRMSGLLIMLATNDPSGDFGYCRYRWTKEERDAFLSEGRVPRYAHELPENTPIIPICYYSQYAECGYQGPMVRPRQYRRLDSSRFLRLVAWDLGGHDTRDELATPIIIPTDDLLPTEAQRATFELALRKKTSTPLLSALFKTGKYPVEYAASHVGMTSYSEANWNDVVELLDHFTLNEPFEHPPSCHRMSMDYQHTLQSIQQQLFHQHQRLRNVQDEGGLLDDQFEEED